MAGGRSSSSNPAKARKRVEAAVSSTLARARDGSAFARCEECDKNVPVALIGMHSCSLDAKIKLNLEAQVMEKPPETKKPAERKKATSTEPKTKKSRAEKKEKKGRNPNTPKRPPTAFFLFMDDFRKAFKEANPDSKDVKRVAKEGGEKWKSLTDEEKKPYLDRASELKAEYDKAVEMGGEADKTVEKGDEDDEGDAEQVPAKDVEEVSDGE